jgi:hypothetical protein
MYVCQCLLAHYVKLAYNVIRSDLEVRDLRFSRRDDNFFWVVTPSGLVGR